MRFNNEKVEYLLYVCMYIIFGMSIIYLYIFLMFILFVYCYTQIKIYCVDLSLLDVPSIYIDIYYLALYYFCKLCLFYTQSLSRKGRCDLRRSQFRDLSILTATGRNIPPVHLHTSRLQGPRHYHTAIVLALIHAIFHTKERFLSPCNI